MELVHSLRARIGRGRVSEVCRLLETAAGEHAAALGAGTESLRTEGRAWMLARLGLRAVRWPSPGEEVEVRTWPSRRTAGARAWREFELMDKEGRLVAEAASIWLMVDLARRWPVRLPRFLHELPFPARDTAVEFLAPPSPAGPPTRCASWRVESAHLDINEHVNNVIWVEWAEEAAGWPRPARLQADYVGEARRGETVTFQTWEGWEGRRLVQMAAAGGRPCLRLQWW